ncbi:MAG: hypothetical protein WCG27_13355 [Pseudomonadota bacterium]
MIKSILFFLILMISFQARPKAPSFEKLRVTIAAGLHANGLFAKAIKPAYWPITLRSGEKIALQIDELYLVGESAAAFILAAREHLLTGKAMPKTFGELLPSGANLELYYHAPDLDSLTVYFHRLHEVYPDVGIRVYGPFAGHQLPTPITTADTASIVLRSKAQTISRWDDNLRRGEIQLLSHQKIEINSALAIFDQCSRFGLTLAVSEIDYLWRSFAAEMAQTLSLATVEALFESLQVSVVRAKDLPSTWALAEGSGLTSFIEILGQRFMASLPAFRAASIRRQFIEFRLPQLAHKENQAAALLWSRTFFPTQDVARSQACGSRFI